MDMPKNKKFVYVGLVVIVLLAVILYLVCAKQGLWSNKAEESANTTTPTVSSTVTTPKKSSTKAPLSATQAYLDAIKMYKTVGYYFQFVNCHGLPGSLTLKAGKKFMLDNRDAKSHKIAIVGGQSFNVGAYGFAIATAPSKIGTHYITCDGGGAAKIEVQK